MTHDELLAAIDDPMCHVHNDCKSKALRAVVELHKPTEDGIYCDKCYCSQCCHIAVYPCKTIQAIEKELQ